MFCSWTENLILTFCRPVLPEFLLDFGYIVYGLVVSRTITLSNVGHCPVSFSTAHRALEGTGYSIDLGEKIRALPSNECLDFTVRFDPAAIKCTKGKVSTLLPFNVSISMTFFVKILYYFGFSLLYCPMTRFLKLHASLLLSKIKILYKLKGVTKITLLFSIFYYSSWWVVPLTP